MTDTAKNKMNTNIPVTDLVGADTAKDMMSELVKQSDGTALNITAEEMEDGIGEISNSRGILLSPQGIAAYLGLKKLIEKDWMNPDDLLFIRNRIGWAF